MSTSLRTPEEREHMRKARQYARDAATALANVSHYLAIAGVGTCRTSKQYESSRALNKRVTLLAVQIERKG